MRFLLYVMPLLAATSAIIVDPEAAKELFDSLIEEDGLELDEYDYADRLQKFQINLLASDGTAINADLMFTAAERLKMNGARMINGLKSAHQEELKKRGEDEYAEIYKRGLPPVYDGRVYRGRPGVNPVQHQLTCGNCYLHTFIAALEISYFRATGKLVKYSEQELTDCYANGCGGGDYRMVAITMSYLDKLSARTVYGKYLDNPGTCRMGSTPDALTRIKVVDFVDVAPADAAAAVLKYGSVMTCLKWDSIGGLCDFNGYTGGVVNKPAVAGGCDHAVLIVGFTPAYWIVRNSHGTDWGEGGYFKIVRGRNACGIEEGMAALITESRPGKSGLRPNGCPADKPNYCPSLKSCTAYGRCLGLEEEEEEVVEREIEDEDEDIEEREEEEEIDLDMDADEEEIDLEKREIRIPGEEREKRDIRIPGKLQRILKKRGVSDEDLAEYFAKRSDDDEEDVEKRACRDQMDNCPSLLAAYGKGTLCTTAGAAQCALTCGTCSNTNTNVNKPSGEPSSDCVAPRIPNGKTRSSIVKHGAPLQIRCAPGYVLVGNDHPTCLVQDVFTNDDKDGRLLPECIRLGSNTLSGNGAGYRGSLNTYSYQGKSYPCDSWNKDILRGVVQNRKDAMAMAIGNHNLCRNPGGMEPVPFCIGSASGVGKVHYCFKGPGCDSCAGASDAAGAGFCSNPRVAASCSYSVENTKNTVKDIQGKCQATCCRINGC